MMLAIVHDAARYSLCSLHFWQPRAANAPCLNKCCFALCQHMEKPMELSQQFLSAVEEQYACLYLNSLGASNSEANMCVCMLHARSPRVRCAAWVCVCGAHGGHHIVCLVHPHALRLRPRTCITTRMSSSLRFLCLFDVIIHDA